MEAVFEILNQIANTSSRIEKENILRVNESNSLLKEVLFRVYNPFIVYGIGKKKLNKFLKSETANSEFDSLLDILDYLEINNTGSDEDAAKVARFINAQHPEYKKIITETILKTLKIGVTANTINKIYKGLIPVFKVQLAKKYEDEVHKVEGREFVLTEKMDGQRLLLRVENRIVKAFSRSGQPVLGLVDIFKEAKGLPNGFYDGELLIANADDYKDRDVLQETLKITRKDGEKKHVQFHIFDYITLEEFDAGKTREGYKVRRRFIENNVPTGFQWIKVLPVLYEGKDLSVIPEILSKLEKDGKEGLMLNLDAPWENKRTSSLLKVKSMNEFDERIVDMIEGEGKYEGTLGAVVVNYKGNNTLKIGSGFTEEERDFFWKNKDKLIGRVITIQYFRESQNQDGGLSVSFPVFKALREEGKEVSYF